MEANNQRLKRRDDALSSLNAVIGAAELARDTTNVTPARDVFDSASVLLNTIKVSFFLTQFSPSLVDCWLIYWLCLGLGDQRSGICGAGAHLRQYLPGSSPGDESTWSNHSDGN